MTKQVSGDDTDRRRAIRAPTHRSGKILCGVFAWDCVIRDLSTQGARVRLLTGAAPPGRVQLVDLAAGLAHDVVVAWQRDREIGVRITRTYDLRGLAPAAAGTAKRLWQAARKDLTGT